MEHKTLPDSIALSVLHRFAPEDLREALRKMYLIRKFEEGAEACYMRGLIHGTMHLCIGQEASSVGACLPLKKSDKITSTHRGHGHSIAKGADISKMFAEFFGKETGYCRGRGGSMHIADPAGGNLGANGIVGGGLPIAVGAALSAKRLKTGDVTVCFFGDGANNEGAFHEALNMAAIWKLPVVFLCENNHYGMSMAASKATAAPSIAARAAAYDLPGESIDGNDLLLVADTTEKAVDRARAGEGPSLIEAITYRWRGHSKSDRNRYRSKEEMNDWMTRDPIPRFASVLIDNGIITRKTVETLEQETSQAIESAIAFARNQPDPATNDLTRDVYTPL